MTQNDERIRRLIDEANRLRYSRRQILRSGAALGLSSAGIATVLRTTGTAAAPRPTRYQLSGKLNILAGSYFVPEAQDFFVKQVTDWGSQNGVDVSCDFINWPDIQARISAAVESGAGPDIVEMREAWQYLYYEQMSDLNELAM
jgi:multiple sugar transport system substrate-binding protein